LHTRRLGEALLLLEECDSTNGVAAELASAGAPEGLTVIAEKQNRGRGRSGRSWVSPSGGLWMTVVLRPPSSFQASICLPLIGALAIARAINTIYRTGVSLRWPNDVVLHDRKLAGTLAEARTTGEKPEYALLGLGVDTNFPTSSLGDATANATTLSDSIGHEIDNLDLIAGILGNLEELYRQVSDGRDVEILNLLMQIDASAGRRLTVLLEDGRVSGVFEKYLTLSSVQIFDGHDRRQVETSAAVSVEYLRD